MVKVGDARGAHDLIERRASSVAAVFSRLGGDVPLPLVAHELARHGVLSRDSGNCPVADMKPAR